MPSLAPIRRAPIRALTTRARLSVAAAAALVALGAPAAYATLGDSTGTVAAPAVGSGAESEPFLETRLLFGTERSDGGPAVTDTEFTAFVDREVTPQFPAGLTVQEGRGQWRDAAGRIVRERSYELILLYPTADAGPAGPKIERIREAYRSSFGQESVGRVDNRVRVDF
ncbi:DUF3574 domain-containing protein [Streptomyces sp. NPDC047928]|uniref:DUF3574 domain-containing protein n=1 Tax=unclassified Streptomyces TaxID=2593676 RepID=UPI003716BA7E